MKPYLITITAVVVTDDTPTENSVDVMVGQDYPTITSTKIVEMVPKGETPEPVRASAPETPCPMDPRQMTLPINGRATYKRDISTRREHRTRSGDPCFMTGERDRIEYLFTSNGYTKIARDLGVGTYVGPNPEPGVWLTKAERDEVQRVHVSRHGSPSRGRDQ
ncbi:MAG: hypothetical protein CMH39_00260 [Micrococcales bacterium]|nr:hypothetical protein [Micrococcales bacterium]